jgi:hypothetical protein
MIRKATLVAPALAILLALSGCASSHERHEGTEGNEGKEVPVTLNDCPPAVRATLLRESAGGKVDEVEREVKNGRTIYSADITVGGVAWDIAVAEDGAVISREREDQNKDKEKDEENEKEEHGKR